MNPEDHPNVRIPPPLIVAVLLVSGLWRDGALWPLRFNGGPSLEFGALLIVSGITIGGSAIRGFVRAGTHLEPWKPSSALLTDGVYRWTRNPMYLAMILVAGGVAASIGGPWTAGGVAVIWVILNTFVIPREEAYLRRRFRADYEAYVRSVRRWLGHK